MWAVDLVRFTVLLAALTVCSAAEDRRNIQDYERHSLRDIYTSAGGDGWRWQSSAGRWNFTDPDVNPCTPGSYRWEGLGCVVFGDYYYISNISLSSYNLRGSLSDSIGNLTSLTSIDLSFNNLTSTVPTSIENLTSLQALNLERNSLTGTVQWLCGISSLVFLNIYQNHMSGTIVDCIDQLQSLEHLDIGNNHIEGSIPASLGNLANLQWLGLHENQITGQLPSSLGGLQRLTDIYTYYNLLTGPLPSAIGHWISMVNMGLDSNFHIGEVPNVFDTLSELVSIQLYDNLFSGSLPSTVSCLSRLELLFLQDNSFSGKITEILDSQQQLKLSNIQLSSNQLTGTIPDRVFQNGRSLNSLTAFSAGKNCIEAVLPRTICNATGLVTLSLDGLYCASSCRNYILPQVSQSYYLAKSVQQHGILDCLLQLPNLTLLHLSGIGLTGTIPDTISDSLLDLSLSYNNLKGTIPSSIQYRTWRKLDLSQNRIGGTLRTAFAFQNTSSSDIQLFNNRLSGDVPSSLHGLMQISVVGGNLFVCSLDERELPVHDDRRAGYQCGSNEFNILYYVWLGLAAVLVGVLLWVYRYKETLVTHSKAVRELWHLYRFVDLYGKVGDDAISKETSMSNYRRYVALYDVSLRNSWFCSAMIMCFLLPIYTGVSAFYSTHTYQYAWTVSAAWLSGYVAFGVLFAAFVVFLLVNKFSVALSKVMTSSLISNVTMNSSNRGAIDDGAIDRGAIDDGAIDDGAVNDGAGVAALEAAEESSRREAPQAKHPSLKKALLYFVFVAVNLFFVTGANFSYVYLTYAYNSTNTVFNQVALSAFKVFWSNLAFPLLSNWVVYFLSEINVQFKADVQRFYLVQLAVTQFNNIVIPCIVVSVVSPNCYYNVFVQEPDVVSSFVDPQCVVRDESTGLCNENILYKRYTSYDPPFIYSYQCSSSIVTAYATVFVMMCLATTFISPLIMFALHWAMRRLDRTSVAYQALALVAPTILHPVTHQPDGLRRNLLRPIVPANQMLVSDLTYVGILFTFGVWFPLLVLPLVIAITAKISYRKVVYNSFVKCIVNDRRLLGYCRVVEEECGDFPSWHLLNWTGWFMLSLSCCLYAIILFDVLGDVASIGGSYWVFIVMALLPVVAYVVGKLNSRVIIPAVMRRRRHSALELTSMPQRASTTSITTTTTSSSSTHIVHGHPDPVRETVALQQVRVTVHSVTHNDGLHSAATADAFTLSL
jgi:Leucine-rich repeat (LRR) protein